ncbi:hypothetical protein BDA96_10G201900, partial [Sorghum bicolor]
PKWHVPHLGRLRAPPPPPRPPSPPEPPAPPPPPPPTPPVPGSSLSPEAPRRLDAAATLARPRLLVVPPSPARFELQNLILRECFSTAVPDLLTKSPAPASIWVTVASRNVANVLVVRGVLRVGSIELFLHPSMAAAKLAVDRLPHLPSALVPPDGTHPPNCPRTSEVIAVDLANNVAPTLNAGNATLPRSYLQAAISAAPPKQPRVQNVVSPSSARGFPPSAARRAHHPCFPLRPPFAVTSALAPSLAPPPSPTPPPPTSPPPNSTEPLFPRSDDELDLLLLEAAASAMAPANCMSSSSSVALDAATEGTLVADFGAPIGNVGSPPFEDKHVLPESVRLEGRARHADAWVSPRRPELCERMLYTFIEPPVHPDEVSASICAALLSVAPLVPIDLLPTSHGAMLLPLPHVRALAPVGKGLLPRFPSRCCPSGTKGPPFSPGSGNRG